jgi:hypothetical protein
VTSTEASAAVAERCRQQRRQWHTTIKRAEAERCSVQLGSGSSGSGCRNCCGSSGSGRTLQRAAGQRQRRQWHTTIKRAEAERCSVQLGSGSSGSGCRICCGIGGSGRTLQRAVGQRQRQRRQWQNAAACGVAAAAAVAATVASAVVAAATVAASMSRPVRPVCVDVFRTGACVGRLKHKTELPFAGRLATSLVLAIICSAGEVLVLESVLKT